MKIRIDKSGSLEIERNGDMKPQYCPFTNFHKECGDHCPLFGEPILASEGLQLPGAHKIDMLRLCYKLLEGQIIDERVKP